MIEENMIIYRLIKGTYLSFC